MNAAITLAISMIARLVPSIAGNAPMITTVITDLTDLMPLLVKAEPIVFNWIKQVVATLKADPATTPEQLEVLKQIDVAADAAYDAADKPQPGDPDYVAPAGGQ